MATTYSITEAQAKFPALVRESSDHPIAITRHDKVVGYLLSSERLEAIMETLEVLGDADAMKAIQDYEAGKTTFHPLSALDAADDG